MYGAMVRSIKVALAAFIIEQLLLVEVQPDSGSIWAVFLVL